MVREGEDLVVTSLGLLGTSLWFASSRSARVVFLSKLVVDLPEQVLGEGSEEVPSEVQRLEHIPILVGALGDELTLRRIVR
jgi:hypothetical protein